MEIKACCEEHKSNLLHQKSKYNIALIGNPNVGKTLIFNFITGSHQKVANFPGVTVIGKSGSFNYNKTNYSIIDLPGIYGFSSNRPDEQVTHDYLLSSNIDLIINVIDASKLERNLFLTLQLLELSKKMIIILNFMDKVNQEKTSIDIYGLEKYFHVPIIPVTATKRLGLSKINETIEFTLNHQPDPSPISLGSFDRIIDELLREIKEKNQAFNYELTSLRWLVLSTIMMGSSSKNVLPQDFQDNIFYVLNQIEQKYFEEDGEFQLSLISNQYSLIQNIISKHVVYHKDRMHERISMGDRIDKILLHNVLGFIVFFIMMGIVFIFTFEISAPLSHGLEYLASMLSNFIWNHISNDLVASFLADGLIGGVGFVLVFIPQIAILFLLLSVLEHSGYMARVVFITDRFLNKLGISGKSIAPMLLGLGCNVPAIMSTSSISDQNERITIAIVNPFLPCSARFPVFVIFSSAIFGKYAGIVVTGIYFVGIVISILMMYILRKTILKGETMDLILEMNDLSIPPISAILSQVYLQVRKFIESAATWMALGLIVMWSLSITGPSGYIGPEALHSKELLQKSWIYIIGDTVQPIFGLFGWDSRIVTALIFGFIAKEIVIGSLGIIYGVGGDLVALNGILNDQFTFVSAIAFMLFVLAYIPCIGTYFALRREVGSKWANFSVINGLIIAWLLAFLTITIGGWLF